MCVCGGGGGGGGGGRGVVSYAYRLPLAQIRGYSYLIIQARLSCITKPNRAIGSQQTLLNQRRRFAGRIGRVRLAVSEYDTRV